jgi:hypothetical protein
MNKLKGNISYLISPLDRNSLDKARLWRKDIKNFLKSINVIPIDPLDKPVDDFLEDEEFLKKRQEYLENGNYQAVSDLMKPIRIVDLRFTDKADFIICDLDLSAYPCGTYEEIFTSNRAKKPIIIHCPQGIKKIPLWLFGTLDWELFFDNWNDVKLYLLDVNSGKDERTFNRWQFLNWDKLKEGTNL